MGSISVIVAAPCPIKYAPFSVYIVGGNRLITFAHGHNLQHLSFRLRNKEPVISSGHVRVFAPPRHSQSFCVAPSGVGTLRCLSDSLIVLNQQSYREAPFLPGIQANRNFRNSHMAANSAQPRIAQPSLHTLTSLVAHARRGSRVWNCRAL